MAVVVPAMHRPVTGIRVFQHGVGNGDEILHGANDGYALWRFRLGTPSIRNPGNVLRDNKTRSRSEWVDLAIDTIAGEEMGNNIEVVLSADTRTAPRWHIGLNISEQQGRSLGRPAQQKRLTGQNRAQSGALQIGAMAGCAVCGISRSTGIGLGAEANGGDRHFGRRCSSLLTAAGSQA